ncbi:MAG: type II toxin-antitoxin system HicB family antitoxin [Allobaculum sp.]|nr:type II toxin-antitoxin system HicB family antitoxin [Allobaculum sp.]
MSIISYPALFFPEEDGRIFALFPDLSYTMAWGFGFSDTYSMAVDALAGYIDSCRKNGNPIPKSSDPLTLIPEKLEEEEEEEYFVVMVTVDVDHYIETIINPPKSEEE